MMEEPMSVLSCRVQTHKLQEIKKVAKGEYRSVSNFIAILIDKFIAEHREEQNRKNQPL